MLHRRRFTRIKCSLLTAGLALAPLGLCAEEWFEKDAFGNINQRNIGIGKSNKIERPIKNDVREQSDQRQLSRFSRLEVKVPVTLYYTEGGPALAKLEGSKATLKALKLKVNGDTLVIDGNYSHFQGVPTIHLQGGNLQAATFHSAGEMDLQNLRGLHFALKVRGAADVQVAGKVSECTIDSQGAGDIDQSGLICEQVHVTSFGANDIQVYASQSVSGRLQGAGDLAVNGNPAKRELSLQGAFDVEYF